MRVLLNSDEVETFAVEDGLGKRHSIEDGGARPFPFCVQCGHQVDAIAAIILRGRGALVYAARCHGEEDLIHFRQDDGHLVALPCFRASLEERRNLLVWLAQGAPDDGAPN